MTYSVIKCEDWWKTEYAVPTPGLWKIEDCADGSSYWFLDGATYTPPLS